MPLNCWQFIVVCYLVPGPMPCPEVVAVSYIRPVEVPTLFSVEGDAQVKQKNHERGRFLTSLVMDKTVVSMVKQRGVGQTARLRRLSLG